MKFRPLIFAFIALALAPLAMVAALAAPVTTPLSAPAQPYFSHVVIKTSGTSWVVPSGVTWVQVMGCGAGAGGGGVAAAAATASGGNGGTYAAFLYKVTPGATITYGIGAHGAGGSAGNNNGNDGGDTTFGTLTWKGGLHGTGSSSGNASGPSGNTSILLRPGLDPTSTVISLQLPGFTSGLGGLGSGVGGNGGNSPWGTGGVGSANAGGGNGTGHCSGGAGGGQSTTPAEAGGNGTDGEIVVLY